MNRFLLFFVLVFGLSGIGAWAEGTAKPSDSKLVILAKLIEIPGTGKLPEYPKGSVYYNHVYILKYQVEKVLEGKYAEKEILVGQYMPRIPRAGIKDKMDKFVDGDVREIKAGDTHKLVLDLPITKFWDREDAIFDDYFDTDEGDRYFALKMDLVPKKEKK